MNKKSVLDVLNDMITKYEEYMNKKPYIVLVSKKCFNYLIELQMSMEYYFDTERDEKLHTIYGVPVEISNYINCEAICMNEENYKDYCRDKFNLEICLKMAQDLDYWRGEDE